MLPSTIARHLGFSLLLAATLTAQERARAVAPAHSPAGGSLLQPSAGRRQIRRVPPREQGTEIGHRAGVSGGGTP